MKGLGVAFGLMVLIVLIMGAVSSGGDKRGTEPTTKEQTTK
jgi:hypothetical protein